MELLRDSFSIDNTMLNLVKSIGADEDIDNEVVYDFNKIEDEKKEMVTLAINDYINERMR